MNPRTTTSGSGADAARSRRRPPSVVRRPGLYLAVAAAGAVMMNVIIGADPAAQAGTAQSNSVSVAQQLGLTSQSSSTVTGDELQPLQELAASRSEREAEQAAAVQAQQAADQAERDRQAAEAAAAEKAAADARAAEEAKAAAARAAAATPASFQDYALQKLGGDAGQMSCLEHLWGRESGWDPNAQNKTSTAYGIAQFLNSTWQMTGIAKTSDGYRQIDAGLVYLDKAYGSPCGGWAHSQATGWY
jgi:Transglycosylase SLT domain